MEGMLTREQLESGGDESELSGSVAPAIAPSGREDVCGIFGVLPEVWYRLETTHCVGNTPVDSANLPSFAPIISTLNEKEDTKETKKSSPRWGKGRCS